MPADPLLSQAEVKGRFDYNPETGVFVDKSSGKVAGVPDANGYLRVHLGGRSLGLHRVAFMWMLGHWPFKLVDHVNGVTSDNRWANLRPADARQNAQNRRPADANFGYKGVKRNANGRWTTSIMVNGKQRRVPGSFESAFAAHQAYREVAIKHFGQFARFDAPAGRDRQPEKAWKIEAQLAELDRRRVDLEAQLKDVNASMAKLSSMLSEAVVREDRHAEAARAQKERVRNMKEFGLTTAKNPIVPPYHPER